MEPLMMFMGGQRRDASPDYDRGEMTVRQFAKREQVDERTVRRWIEKGALVVRRTPGGHFRIKGTK